MLKNFLAICCWPEGMMAAHTVFGSPSEDWRKDPSVFCILNSNGRTEHFAHAMTGCLGVVISKRGLPMLESLPGQPFARGSSLIDGLVWKEQSCRDCEV